MTSVPAIRNSSEKLTYRIDKNVVTCSNLLNFKGIFFEFKKFQELFGPNFLNSKNQVGTIFEIQKINLEFFLQ